MNALNGKVHCLYAGPFGADVANRLTRWTRVSTYDLMESPSLESIIEDRRPIFVALWRAYKDVCETIDELALKAGAPVVYASLDQRWLQIGPAVDPGVGPCFRCFRRRSLSHSSSLDRERALDAAYQADHQLGVRGHLGAHAEMAASMMIDLMQRISDSSGRVIRIDLVNGGIVEGRVVAIHGCRRCRAPDDTPGDRFTRHLVTALKASYLS